MLATARDRRDRDGFTLIELMVVIAIIVLAAGLMTPTITDFFKNRQLESVRGKLGAAFNTARLRAVNEGRRMSMVFFREGVRVYDERNKRFPADSLFNPDDTPQAKGLVWFKLGFLGDGKYSTDLPKYRDWEAQQLGLAAAGSASKGKRSSSRKSRTSRTTGARSAEERTFNVEDLPRIIFERDGSLTFARGSDVSSAYFKENIPVDADIIIYQADNDTACFIDLRPPGQFRSKMVPTGKIMPRPLPSSDAGSSGGRKR